jgi:DNA-3-methyladenine glycosylase
VARDLIGNLLVHQSGEGVTSGVIVETEAYIGESDPACHAASGPTSRNEPLYGRPGHAYVYLNYGMHCLVNAVTEAPGTPAAVLIRALEPVSGIELMQARRYRPQPGHRRDVPTCQLCRGPGNLTRALGITLRDNRVDLTAQARATLWIEPYDRTIHQIGWSSRIGICVGTDKPWRCFVVDHPCVSGGRAR